MNFLKKIYYNKYSKQSYSLSNVDLIIDRLFINKKKGIYIDVGCNHPIKYNNTYLLHKRGWLGINVDLDHESITEFNKFRKRDFNYQAVVSSSNETKKIFFYHSRSTINTIDKKIAQSRDSEVKQIINSKTITLNEIVEMSPFKNDKINFLSIDIENHEYEALKYFDFNKYKIDVIVTECLEFSTLKKPEIYNQSLNYIQNTKLYKLLENNNYKLVNWVNSDLVFVYKDFKF
tara:strand:- start:232 stop:927 length:696 start_codon:yes stop_codon:yes gene_type:complete